jgi:hypothetical protein
MRGGKGFTIASPIACYLKAAFSLVDELLGSAQSNHYQLIFAYRKARSLQSYPIIISETDSTRRNIMAPSILQEETPRNFGGATPADLRNPQTSGTAEEPRSRDLIIFSGMSYNFSLLDAPPLTKNTDFDGTIFMQDTGHILFDSHGCGPTQREVLDRQITTGERSFREVSEEMWGSLSVPFDDAFAVMKSALEIDTGFRDFHEFCIAENIPFNVISAGLKPILRRVLDDFLGVKQVC